MQYRLFEPIINKLLVVANTINVAGALYSHRVLQVLSCTKCSYLV